MGMDLEKPVLDLQSMNSKKDNKIVLEKTL